MGSMAVETRFDVMHLKQILHVRVRVHNKSCMNK